MRMMIGLAAAMLWAAPAMATDWFWVETAQDDTTVVFVDRDSIQNMGMKMRRASVAYVASEAESDGAIGYLSTLEYDCADPRYRFVDVRGFGVDGDLFTRFPGSGTWRDIKDGTLDDAAREFVCSGGEEPSGTKSYGAELPVAAGLALLAADDSTP